MVRPSLSRWMALGGLLLATPPLPAQRPEPAPPAAAAPVRRVVGEEALQGVVRDAGSGRGLDGARVEIEGTGLLALTDGAGAFRFADPPPGARVVAVRRVGYAPRRLAVELRPGETAILEIALEIGPVPVEGVEGRAGRSARERSGFERRRRLGHGVFLTREEFARTRPRRATELLARVPGVELVQTHLGMYALRMRGSAPLMVTRPPAGRGAPPVQYVECPVRYFIDGTPANAVPDPTEPVFLDHLVRPEEIDAIEVYRGPSEAPAEFKQSGADCGVVLIWKRTDAGRR